MMTRLLPTLAGLGLCGLLPLWAADAPKPSLPPAAAGSVDFARDVQPILTKSCLNCHNAAKRRGGLRLDDAAAALAGGDSGAVIVPGAKAAEGRLLHVVAGLDTEVKMPPDGPPLTAAEVGTLRAWI